MGRQHVKGERVEKLVDHSFITEEAARDGVEDDGRRCAMLGGCGRFVVEGQSFEVEARKVPV
jgi:hypothetical protein